MLSKKYGFAKNEAFGHGEVSSAKHPKEGFTIASAIRSGRTDQVVEEFATKSIENIRPEIPRDSPKNKAGELLDTASTQVNSGLRILEDLFLSGRPSFTDMSTKVIQQTTTNKPSFGHRQKQERAFEFLIERQVS
jgi:hypothetical protein